MSELDISGMMKTLSELARPELCGVIRPVPPATITSVEVNELTCGLTKGHPRRHYDRTAKIFFSMPNPPVNLAGV